MTCEEALILLSGHLDGTNTEAEAAQLREHLDHCPACRELLTAFEEADAGLLSLKEEAPEGLCQSVMEAIRTESKPRKHRRWTNLVVAAGLVLVIGVAALPKESPAAEAVPLTARQLAAPAEATVYEETAFSVEEGYSSFDHSLKLDYQALAESWGADVVVTYELLPEMEVCACETLENGTLLYHLQTPDAAVELSRRYGCELYQPANGSVSDVSYALLTR